MKNCETCRHDVVERLVGRKAICKQGHFRMGGQEDHLPIQDCHAWQEQETKKCWCERFSSVKGGDTVGSATYNFCCECGRKL